MCPCKLKATLVGTTKHESGNSHLEQRPKCHFLGVFLGGLCKTEDIIGLFHAHSFSVL